MAIVAVYFNDLAYLTSLRSYTKWVWQGVLLLVFPILEKVL